MTVPSDLTSRLHELNARISANLNFVPVGLWGFDERAMKAIKTHKHSVVNQKIGAAAQRKLGKAQKQKIAKNLGEVPQTVGEIFEFLSGTTLASRISKGPTASRVHAQSEVKEEVDNEEESEEEDQKLDPKILELLKRRRELAVELAPSVVKQDVEFKKQKQHKPLTAEEKQERKLKRKQNQQKKANQLKSQKNAEIKSTAVADSKKPKEEKENQEDSFKGRDYAALYKKAQKRKEHVEELREQDPEKAERLERNIKFDAAMKRAEGEKDNLEKLAKAVKRKEKSKVKRKSEWSDRVKKVKDDQSKRQEKRQENIEKRRNDKVKKKLERARKKGRLV
ncbi:SURF6 domain-containing protein [Aphelenchoides besseyi]|nr:SURF6 domain-containing protein [Aphelenchoides besseyi]